MMRLSAIRRESRKQAHDKVVRKLGLLTKDGDRFFEAIHASRNRFLFRDYFRLDSEAFDALFELCQPHIDTAVKDQREVLAVALNWIGAAATCRSQEVLFDLAYSTVHKYRLLGVYAIVKALKHLITMPTTVPDEFIQSHPYFDQALCAIDGTHFRVTVPCDDIKRFRNHKGFVTTNALIACDWNMNVCYAYGGAEGSAHDSMVLQWSHFLETIPDDFYVLADASYGLSKKVLTPYRSMRYHLKEWAMSSGRPQNGKELCNLRHAKARNVVERVIGVLKRRFGVLRSCMDYELINIKAVIFACLCVHNFLRRFSSSDMAEDFRDTVQKRKLNQVVNEAEAPIPFDFRNGTAWREWMAAAMWTEYEGCRANDGALDSDVEMISETSSDDGSSISSSLDGSDKSYELDELLDSDSAMSADSDFDSDNSDEMMTSEDGYSDVSSDVTE